MEKSKVWLAEDSACQVLNDKFHFEDGKGLIEAVQVYLSFVEI